MAFRSQRYHLSQGRTKKKKKGKIRQAAKPGGWAAVARGESKEKRRNEECIGVCIGLGGIVLYTRTPSADIAHPEYFIERVWNEIKLATRRNRRGSLLRRFISSIFALLEAK